MGAGDGCRFCKTGNKYPILSRQRHERRLNCRTYCNFLSGDRPTRTGTKKDVGVILLLIPLSGLGEPINQNKQRS